MHGGTSAVYGEFPAYGDAFISGVIRENHRIIIYFKLPSRNGEQFSYQHTAIHHYAASPNIVLSSKTQ